MDDSTLPKDSQALTSLYQQTIKAHQEYLKKLQEAFDNRCEEIRTETHSKIDDIPEMDKKARETVLKEEKELLDRTLEELKYAVSRSSSEAREKLEQIENRREEQSVDLEAQLAAL